MMAGHRCAHGPFRRTPNPQHCVYLCQNYLSCSFSLHSSPHIPFHRCSSCVPVPAPRALRMFPQASILGNLKVCGMEFKAGIRPVSRPLRTSRGRFCRLVSEGEYGSSRNRRSVSGPTQPVTADADGRPRSRDFGRSRVLGKAKTTYTGDV